jgi:hypothetical protein
VERKIVNQLNLNSLTQIAESAFKEVSPSDLAFLFASGKSEGFLRDQLGTYSNRILETRSLQHVTREWKKHDLAVMDASIPMVVIEGKSWICHDAFRKTKLLTDKKSIFQGTLKDVKKLVATRDRYPGASIYVTTVIYGVDTSTVNNFENFNITYGDSHHKGIRAAGSFSQLVEASRSHVTVLHTAFGPTKRFPLEVGSFKGMKIQADFFVTEIIDAPGKNLKREIDRQIS